MKGNNYAAPHLPHPITKEECADSVHSQQACQGTRWIEQKLQPTETKPWSLPNADMQDDMCPLWLVDAPYKSDNVAPESSERFQPHQRSLQAFSVLQI